MSRKRPIVLAAALGLLLVSGQAYGAAASPSELLAGQRLSELGVARGGVRCVRPRTDPSRARTTQGMGIRSRPHHRYSTHFDVRSTRRDDRGYSYGLRLSLPRGGYRQDTYCYEPYVRYYGRPYRSVSVRHYRTYVILDTPTVSNPRDVIEVRPYAPRPYVRPKGLALPQAEERVFESRLAVMLGGTGRVGAALALGEAKLKAGEFEEAIVAFQAALGQDPEDALPRIGLALALLGDEQYESAAYMLRRGLSALPDRGSVRLELTEVFGGAESYEAVEARLAGAARDDPSDADARLLLGFQYLATGRYTEAAKVLLAAHEAAPADALVNELLLAAERHVGSEAQEHDEDARAKGEQEETGPE